MHAPTVIVSQKGAARARAGHPWIFRGDITQAPSGLISGSEVRIADARGNFIARGFWAVRSPIALRVLSRTDSPLDEELLATRLRRAFERRKAMFPQADAFRVVHGEADLLPGWFADMYDGIAAVQHLSEWAEARREQLARMLVEVTGARAVVARDDGSARDFEQLPRRAEPLLGTEFRAQYHEGALALEVDLLADHKTGGYLDQRENHLRAGELARGLALDAFCYHGGFALQLARKAAHVLAIDQDAGAVQRTRKNAERNGLGNVEARAQNAVEALRALDQEGRKFDTIVLDPPAFAKRKEGLEGALRAYREINYRAVRLLAPGGLLVTCSCSGRVTSELFGEVVAWAAQEAKRPLQLLERRGAGRDHPPLVGVPETEYLKAFFLLAP
ncbi:MAG TPA: class I SAM-dependent rRNA methyltransferase [Myxococcales bacterium]|nr:class I SAM-dependent rRNA methyltransferase [Myxococcales bacterium]